MTSVDIYTTAICGYDIVILNTGQYQSQRAFDHIVYHILSRVSRQLLLLIQPNQIEFCAEYTGIAMRISGILPDRAAAKRELETLLQEAVDRLN